MAKKQVATKQFTVKYRCDVEKACTVEARTEEEARAKAEKWEVEDELETQQFDWRITSVKEDR